MRKDILKSFNDNLKVTGNKLYLCIWNWDCVGDEITEIHTFDSLLHEYDDIKKKYLNFDKLAWSGLTWSKIFIKLDNFKSHQEDNMYIKRIR